jgi:hypothetical protein
MTDIVNGVNHVASRTDHGEAISRHLIFIGSFTAFLLVAAVSRLMPWHWRRFFKMSGRHKSVLAEAREGAATVTPFAFMG